MSKNFKSIFLGRLYRLMLICLALYAVACIGCASYQRRLIYFPPHLTPEEVNDAAGAAGLKHWNDLSGRTIGMKRPSPRQPAEGQVLIAYGNGSWTVGCAHYADDIQKLAAFDVFILEYPGYADRAGCTQPEKHFPRGG